MRADRAMANSNRFDGPCTAGEIRDEQEVLQAICHIDELATASMLAGCGVLPLARHMLLLKWSAPEPAKNRIGG